MAKNNKTKAASTLQHPVLTALSVGFIGWFVANSINVDNSDITNSAMAISGSLLVVLACYIFFNRSAITHTKIIKIIGILVSAFLIVFGWKLTSYAVPPENIQSDGYNVTGGFMMLAGGFYWGYSYARERLQRGKK